MKDTVVLYGASSSGIGFFCMLSIAVTCDAAGGGEDDIKNLIDLELLWSVPDDDAKDEVCTGQIWPLIAARAKLVIVKMMSRN